MSFPSSFCTISLFKNFVLGKNNVFVLLLFQNLLCHVLNVGGDSESRRKRGGALWICWLLSGSFNTKKSLILTYPFQSCFSPTLSSHHSSVERGILIFIFVGRSLAPAPWPWLLLVSVFQLSDLGYIFKMKEKERYGRACFSKYTFTNQTILMWMCFLCDPGQSF